MDPDSSNLGCPRVNCVCVWCVCVYSIFSLFPLFTTFMLPFGKFFPFWDRIDLGSPCINQCQLRKIQSRPDTITEINDYKEISQMMLND